MAHGSPISGTDDLYGTDDFLTQINTFEKALRFGGVMLQRKVLGPLWIGQRADLSAATREVPRWRCMPGECKIAR